MWSKVSAKNQGGPGKKPEQRRRTSGSGSGNEKFMKNLGIKQAKEFAGEKTRIQDYLDEIKVVNGELKKINLLNSIITRYYTRCSKYTSNRYKIKLHLKM